MSIIIFYLSAIKKLATIVDNGNSQSNIKLTIIIQKFQLKRIPSFSTLKDYILFGVSLLLYSLYLLYYGGLPDIDELKYPLLNSLFKVIKKLATGVDNNNRQSNIKFAIINTKLPTKALSIFFEIARLYTFSRVCAFGS